MNLAATLPGSTDIKQVIADYESDIPSFSDREISLELLDPNSLAYEEDQNFDEPKMADEEESKYDFYSKFKAVLRPKQWMVFHCYYREGYTQEAIAKMFGIAQPVVFEILRAAEARIRRKLGPLVKGFFEYRNKRAPSI